ncbi:MAG TPA: long-chain fatty acid--CoA ligase [Blastocatellia bacterium]|nr:long-chain fatty acid--CoA ligase [Blastocatellia bacterium]
MTIGSFASVGELFETRARQSPHKEFLFSEATGESFTYQEFDRAVSHAAGLLLSRGVKKRDRVSLFLTNRVEYLILYFACFKIGAWAGPVNALLKSHEVEFIIRNSEAETVVTQTDLYAVVAECRPNIASLRNVIVIDDSPGDATVRYSVPTRDQLLAAEHQLPDAGISIEDEAVIIYTSGTTGKPKGVLLTHGNLLSNAQQIAEWLHLTSADRALMVMPLFHVNALMTTCLAALWVGGSVVLAPRFSATRHWEIISRCEVTYFGSVATMLSLLNHTYPEGLPVGVDASRLRFALCGSAPVPVEVLKKYEALFDCPVVEGYGLSESTCRSTFNPPDERRRPGSVGLAIGNEIRIFDDADRELEPGQIGEIVLRGPNLMKGYYRNDEATVDAFRSGWFHTGDLGYRDDEGFIYVVDRKSDMIIRGGENVYPRETDEVLYQHPKIRDAATVGIANELYGEEVKSFVVLRDGAKATEDEIIEFCRQQLADFKCPKTVEFLEEIPKGPTGKLLKRELVSRNISH